MFSGCVASDAAVAVLAANKQQIPRVYVSLTRPGLSLERLAGRCLNLSEYTVNSSLQLRVIATILVEVSAVHYNHLVNTSAEAQCICIEVTSPTHL